MLHVRGTRGLVYISEVPPTLCNKSLTEPFVVTVKVVPAMTLNAPRGIVVVPVFNTPLTDPIRAVAVPVSNKPPVTHAFINDFDSMSEVCVKFKGCHKKLKECVSTCIEFVI